MYLCPYMHNDFIFNFKSDLSKLTIPSKLNNPFGVAIPEIARIATEEFQTYLSTSAEDWGYDFRTRPGKMFGVLVVQKKDNSYAYLGTVSGNLSWKTPNNKLVPSVLPNSFSDLLSAGMIGLTELCRQIDSSDNPSEITQLKATRKLKSYNLQQGIFKHSKFLNLSGEEKNVLQIFQQSEAGNPPAAAGDCAAPKLLQFALKHQLKPIALAEFWWGMISKNKDRKHKVFYPACENRCRPILEYMLEQDEPKEPIL